ncbi:hypothetical protein ACOMHN_010353 [Nucella lapillus]
MDNVSAVTEQGCVTPPGVQTVSLPPPPPSSSRMQALLYSDPIVAYIYIVVLAVALVIGAGGNLLILTVLHSMRNMQSTAKVFVTNLALADLCVAAIADPMCVVAVVKGEAWFDSRQWLCEAVASMCLTACFCAFISLTLASINRFVFICHNQFYHKIFTTKSCIMSCVFAWVLAFCFEFPNVVGWGGHYFDQKNHQCIWDRTSSLAYTMFVSFALIFFPLCVMLVCFILIFRHIYRTKFNLYLFDGEDAFLSRKILLEALRTSRMLMGIFVVFLLCWTPYGVVIVFDFYQELSMELHLFITLLAHMHSSANFLVYIVTNRNFRAAAVHFLSCGLSLSKRGESSQSKSTEIAKISHSQETAVVSQSISYNSA